MDPPPILVLIKYHSDCYMLHISLLWVLKGKTYFSKFDSSTIISFTTLTFKSQTIAFFGACRSFCCPYHRPHCTVASMLCTMERNIIIIVVLTMIFIVWIFIPSQTLGRAYINTGDTKTLLGDEGEQSAFESSYCHRHHQERHVLMTLRITRRTLWPATRKFYNNFPVFSRTRVSSGRFQSKAHRCALS